MKKPRPHKTNRKGRGAAKRTTSGRVGTMQAVASAAATKITGGLVTVEVAVEAHHRPADVTTGSTLPHKLPHQSQSPTHSSREQPKSPRQRSAATRSDDVWRWHGAAVGPAGHNPSAALSRRAKGPPPPKPSRKPVAVAAPSRSVRKLSPALEARLAVPLPPDVAAIPVWQLARQRVASAWRADRVAAVLLLLPTLLTGALLAALPHVKAPLEQTAFVARLRVPPPAADIAIVPTPPIAALPPFARLPEPLTPAETWATHDLAVVVPLLARDVAERAPPFRRPAEGLVASVPMARHDLAYAVTALARDVARAPVVPQPLPETPIVAALPPDVHLPPTQSAAADTAAATTCRAPAGLLEARSTKRDASKHASLLPPLNPDLELADDPLRFGLALSDAAKAQSQELVVYNARYMQIAYPRGDVPALFGVCSDVVIRAYRALDIDLQELVHQSRTGPTDTSIDHRRTELLRKFFATHGESLPVSPYSEDFLPGDIVTYYRPQNKSSTAHIAIVTDELAPSGRPMIAHNRGWGVQLEDALFVDQMTGHYRFRGLSTVAVAALPRNLLTVQPRVVLAALAKRPLQTVAVVTKAVPGSGPVAVGADGEPQAVLTPPRTPPMGLGLSALAVTRGGVGARCEAGAKSVAASCRPAAVPPSAHP